MDGLIQHAETIDKPLARYGVKFGIYRNGEFREQLFPFNPIPWVMTSLYDTIERYRAWCSPQILH